MSQRKEHHKEELYEGEHVIYHPTGSSVTSTGTIKRIVTEPVPTAAGRTAHASEEEPRFVCILPLADSLGYCE